MRQPKRHKVCLVRDMERLTPLKAIRAKCIDCSGHELKEVKNCQYWDCSLYPLRMGKGSRTTLKKVKAYCLECCNGQRNEVKLCVSVNCALWERRFGKRPRKAYKCPNLSEILTAEGVLK